VIQAAGSRLLFGLVVVVGLGAALVRLVLRLFAELREAPQALLIVTHDARVASIADRLLTMRDGAIVAQTRLGPGMSAAGVLASLADLGGDG